MDRSTRNHFLEENRRELAEGATFSNMLLSRPRIDTTRIDRREWKNFLDAHQYHVMYRLLWVNRIMRMLREEYKSKENMSILVELLLGFEELQWKNCEEEMQYIQSMESFNSFCKRSTETWQDLLQRGRSMHLLKGVLRFNLVSALPTIYWVDNNYELFLLVGQQCTKETQVLFQKLTDSWNQHLHETSPQEDPIHLSDLPAHQISQETMQLALHSSVAYGAVLEVFEGIIDQCNQTVGLGVAVLPVPVQEYLKLLWKREVRDSTMLPGCHLSLNILKLVLPGVLCHDCRQPKEVGTLFGLRAAVPETLARIEGDESLAMHQILYQLSSYHRAFGKLGEVPDVNQTSALLCQVKRE